MPDIRVQLAAAVEKRGRYFQSVQRCHDLIKVGIAKQGEFLTRARQIGNTFVLFEESVDKINCLNLQLPEGETPVRSDEAMSALETLYYEIKDHESTVLTQISRAEAGGIPASTPVVAVAPPSTKVKLPIIFIVEILI